MTLALEQIDRIVGNKHHNPFEILGPHQVEENGKKVWVVRSYLPNAESVSVMIPEVRQEYPMQSVHHPHFFTCTIDRPINSRLLKVDMSELFTILMLSLRRY
jgi:1,4-alpha-glucan branching enzyme